MNVECILEFPNFSLGCFVFGMYEEGTRKNFLFDHSHVNLFNVITVRVVKYVIEMGDNLFSYIIDPVAPKSLLQAVLL